MLAEIDMLFNILRVEFPAAFGVITAKAGIQDLDASVRWHDKILRGLPRGHSLMKMYAGENWAKNTRESSSVKAAEVEREEGRIQRWIPALFGNSINDLVQRIFNDSFCTGPFQLRNDGADYLLLEDGLDGDPLRIGKL